MSTARRPADAGRARACTRAAARSSRASVRNPMLALPAIAGLRRFDLEVRAALRDVLADLTDNARDCCDESWRRHTPPRAAYWKAVAVYAGHLARVLR